MHSRDHLLDLAGRCVMVGVRGADPNHETLRADLDACAHARCRAVILFDRDVPTQGDRNIASPEQLRDLIAHIRETLGKGTLIAIDQEGGRVQRLRAERGFTESPSAHAFAALSPADRREHADTLARQLARLGVDLNFAPCADLAVNPGATIIAGAERSFSDLPASVVECAQDIIAAHLQHGVVPCLKHFPGHGSATADSHADLPDITDAWRETDELAPFAACARMPVAMMTAHLLHRAVDPAHPASLSRVWTTGVLRERLAFEGAVITDSLDMRAIRDRHPVGDAAALALRAGADLALDANNMPGPARTCPAPEMTGAILRAIDAGTITPADLERAAQRVDRLTGRAAPNPAPPPA